MRSLTNVRRGARVPALLSLLIAFACTGGDEVTAPSAADLTITAAAGGSRVISALPAQNDFGTVAIGGTSTRTITVQHGDESDERPRGLDHRRGRRGLRHRGGR